MSDFSTVPANIKALDDEYVLGTYGRLPVEFVRASGAVLTDSEGNDYLDFLGGIGCASLGHCHPAVVAALKEQADKLWQVGNYFYVENRGEVANGLSTLLSRITDESGHDTGSAAVTWKTFFANSGAEANEGAIKLARRWGERLARFSTRAGTRCQSRLDARQRDARVPPIPPALEKARLQHLRYAGPRHTEPSRGL